MHAALSTAPSETSEEELLTLAMARASTALPPQGVSACATLAIVRGLRLAIAHLGNTRAYLIRNGNLSVLTRDDVIMLPSAPISVWEALGLTGAGRPPIPVVCKSLGTENDKPLSLAFHDLAPRDVLLLSTDGLHGGALFGGVEDAVIARTVSGESKTLGTIRDQLYELACTVGGKDNITILIARILDEG